MTGNVSVLAMSLVHWQSESILYLLLVTVCYVIGSFYSGVIPEIVTFDWTPLMAYHSR